MWDKHRFALPENEKAPGSAGGLALAVKHELIQSGSSSGTSPGMQNW